MTQRGEAELTKDQEALVAASTVVPRVVAEFARRTRQFERDELTSIAYLSLRRAARSFKPQKQVPFDGYAYRFVWLDLKRTTLAEETHHRRERLAALDDGCGVLERASDPGDLFNDTAADARRHVADLAGGILVAVTARLLSEASLAPSESDIERHLDWQKRRKLLWDAVAELGERGRVLVLRYMEGLAWEQVAQALGSSDATVRREHDDVAKLLAARLRARRAS